VRKNEGAKAASGARLGFEEKLWPPTICAFSIS
jgi:hypothetical protein